MKLIGFNSWGGHEFEELRDFLSEQKDSTDIFCLQEVFKTTADKTNYLSGRVNLLEEIEHLLGAGFSFYFTAMMRGHLFDEEQVDFDLELGIAIFYRKSLGDVIFEDKTFFRHAIPSDPEGEKSCSIVMQVLDLPSGLRIVNTHGMTYPVDKLDTDLRIKQSESLLDALDSAPGQMILTGDFNLLPETRSIGMINEKMRNLISENNIENTRSILTGYRGKPNEQKFADYTFVTPGIKVLRFEVPDITISDHLPLILEFDLESGG